MTSRDFCYFLQGYIEIISVTNVTKALTTDQVECIQKHLAMVFVHEIDPTFKNQQELNEIHNSSSNKDIKLRC